MKDCIKSKSNLFPVEKDSHCFLFALFFILYFKDNPYDVPTK